MVAFFDFLENFIGSLVLQLVDVSRICLNGPSKRVLYIVASVLSFLSFAVSETICCHNEKGKGRGGFTPYHLQSTIPGQGFQKRRRDMVIGIEVTPSPLSYLPFAQPKHRHVSRAPRCRPEIGPQSATTLVLSIGSLRGRLANPLSHPDTDSFFHCVRFFPLR